MNEKLKLSGNAVRIYGENSRYVSWTSVNRDSAKYMINALNDCLLGFDVKLNMSTRNNPTTTVTTGHNRRGSYVHVIQGKKGSGKSVKFYTDNAENFARVIS